MILSWTINQVCIFYIFFQEDDAEIAAIRVKELGDWKKITPHEKKVLYRASFCQTFAELNAPTGDWKMITGMVLFAIGVSMWMVIWTQKYGKNFYFFPQSLILIMASLSKMAVKAKGQ